MDRDSYFMEVAKLTSGQSKCMSRKIGAVVVLNNRIIGVGYNGPAIGIPHCVACKRTESGKDLDLCPAIHAEANAIMEALKSCGREGITGATLYCTDRPCINCIKMLLSQGVTDVRYIRDYLSSKMRDWLVTQGNINEWKV